MQLCTNVTSLVCDNRIYCSSWRDKVAKIDLGQIRKFEKCIREKIPGVQIKQQKQQIFYLSFLIKV